MSFLLFAGLVTAEGGLEQSDGLLRFTSSDGTLIESGVANDRYRDVIEEASEDWSYLKFPFFKPHGPYNRTEYAGMYGVGPLARLNICDFAGTPKGRRNCRPFDVSATAVP